MRLCSDCPAAAVRLSAGLLVVLALAGPDLSAAAGQKADKPARVAVARCETATGSLVRREAPDKPWQLVKEGEELYSGDLVLGLPGAALESSNKAVRVNFLSDLGGVTPFPIVETVIHLGDSKDADLTFDLERGRIEFASLKKQGDAIVHGDVESKGYVTLHPGAACSLEVYGRWPAGVPFTREPKPGLAPTLHLLFLVTRGEVGVKVGGQQVAMKAPPGPALIEWDSVTGGDPSPQRLDKLPAWATLDENADVVRQRKARLEEFRKLAVEKSLDAAIESFLNSDDPLKRRVAVNAAGALDDLKRLGNVMTTTKHVDVWEGGVLALRHWIGRGPGQDMKLYQGLIKEAGYKPVEAETVLQLLHSFGDAELARPETYEMLIDSLAHDRLAVRGLAHWHLTRLVPAGRPIGYDPLADKEARGKAIEQWRKLVPHGKLPPKPPPEKP